MCEKECKSCSCKMTKHITKLMKDVKRIGDQNQALYDYLHRIVPIFNANFDTIEKALTEIES